MIKKLQKILSEKVLTDCADLYAYSYDTSPNGDVVNMPLAVVFPTSTKEVSDVMKLCFENNIALVPRGAGTCHCGGCRISEKPSIVMHLSKMDKIIRIDKENLIAIVEPNVVLGEFQSKVEELGLFFPPDPSNLKVSTIGGAIALNSGGPRTFKYGNTKDYVINLEVVLANGDVIITSSDNAKDVTGYNLTQLFVGSEGTLGIITKATLKLIPKPENSIVIFAYFDTIEQTAIGVNEIINSLLTPSTIDLLDKKTLETIEKFNPAGLLTNFEGALLIEVDGIKESVEAQSKLIYDVLINCGAKNITTGKTTEEKEKIWRARRSAFGSVAKLKPNVITEDVVVPRAKIPELICGIQKICEDENLKVCIMGHAGDGNIHPNFALDLEIEKENFLRAKKRLFELAVELGGTLSGEHGIGSEKKEFLNKALSPNAILYMEKIKKLFDEKNILNPNKMF